MRSKRPLIFFALAASVLMFLIAGTLFTHVLQMKKWLGQIKSEVAAQTLARKETAFSRADTNACADEQPLLIGFDEKGKPRCRALTSPPCAPGQYVAAIDPVTLATRCADAGGAMACPAGAYITEFMWLGENHISFSCIPRLDPFLAWKFEPVLSSRGNDE